MIRLPSTTVTILLAVILCGCEEKDPVDARTVSGIAMMVHGLQLQRDHCSALFPASSQKYVSQYERSSAPRYAEILAYERTFETDDRETQLKSLGMSHEEAISWCDKEYPDVLQLFDDNYAGYEEEVVDLLPKLEEAAQEAASRRKQEWENPSGEQDEQLFEAIVDALNRSFESGDWSILARLYDDGTFDCWNQRGKETKFHFLAKSPIPSGARHEIKVLERPYMSGPTKKQPLPKPTHLMKIWFEVSYPSRCSDKKTHRWPEYHFLLTKTEREYKLVHGCPSEEYFRLLAQGPVWRPLSKDFVEKKLASIPEGEWNLVREEMREDVYVSRIPSRFISQYDLSYDQAVLVIDEICKAPQ